MVRANSKRKSDDMKKIKFLLLIFFSVFYLNKTVISAEIDIYKKIDLFGEVLEKINKEYVDEFNQSESMDSAINGLLQSLDPYSSYMSPKIFEEMQTETSGEFGGKGIDTLTGGNGSDTFEFCNQSGNDIIKDYNKADGDKLAFHIQNGDNQNVSFSGDTVNWGSLSIQLEGLTISSENDFIAEFNIVA